MVRNPPRMPNAATVSGKGATGRWILLAVFGAAAAGSGFVVPQFLLLTVGQKAAAQSVNPDAARQSVPSHAVFVPFGELVVNLAEERLTRYLHVNITLQVDSADEQNLHAMLAAKKTILRNWLISYLSDKSLGDVRGAAGMNRARREIQDQFNNVLFAEGTEIVRDVLFEEFSVR